MSTCFFMSCSPTLLVEFVDEWIWVVHATVVSLTSTTAIPACSYNVWFHCNFYQQEFRDRDAEFLMVTNRLSHLSFFLEMGARPQPLHRNDAYGWYFINLFPKVQTSHLSVFICCVHICSALRNTFPRSRSSASPPNPHCSTWSAGSLAGSSVVATMVLHRLPLQCPTGVV
jgi:hypothetical protein